ncbi:hypothetical protein PQX77_021888 [Marasmius sp. AFHP31]|nr:hypothetical protein PQX77_021888 [Marasmius sp. AFHP31]
MDDLFGASAFDEHLLYGDNRSDDDMNERRDGQVVCYDNEDQGEPDERSGDKGTYIAPISQDFPQSLWSLQSPKTRKFDQSTPPSSLTITILHPHSVHIVVFDTLASLRHALKSFNTTRTETPSSFRENLVGLLNEEAVKNAASNQGLKRSSINGRSVPVYPVTDHDPLNGLEATGSYVYHTHNDNLELTSSPEIFQTQQSCTVPVSRLSACFLDLVDMSVKLQHKWMGQSIEETASGQRHQWHISVVSSVPSFVGTELFMKVTFARNVLQDLPPVTEVLKQAVANEPWDYLTTFRTFEPFLRHHRGIPSEPSTLLLCCLIN